MEIKLHEFQATILRELLFKPGARFRDLNKVDITNDHFTFHLKRLLQEELVFKKAGQYFLSTKGKEFANRMDTESLKLEKQGKIAVALHATRVNGGKVEYLIHKRLKEPFFGWYGSHSGKIRWGETPKMAAQREFLEETGLTGDFTLKGIVHYFHFFGEQNLQEDKYFFVYKVINLRGELLEEVQGGQNIWMTENMIRQIKNIFATFDEMLEVLDSKDLVFVERNKIVENY